MEPRPLGGAHLFLKAICSKYVTAFVLLLHGAVVLVWLVTYTCRTADQLASLGWLTRCIAGFVPVETGLIKKLFLSVHFSPACYVLMEISLFHNFFKTYIIFVFWTDNQPERVLELDSHRVIRWLVSHSLVQWQTKKTWRVHGWWIQSDGRGSKNEAYQDKERLVCHEIISLKTTKSLTCFHL